MASAFLDVALGLAGKGQVAGAGVAVTRRIGLALAAAVADSDVGLLQLVARPGADLLRGLKGHPLDGPLDLLLQLLDDQLQVELAVDELDEVVDVDVEADAAVVAEVLVDDLALERDGARAAGSGTFCRFSAFGWAFLANGFSKIEIWKRRFENNGETSQSQP